MERIESAHAAHSIPSTSSPSGETRAVILAGVHAWGENVLDELIPRPMLPVVDRPLIGHVLGWLGRAGIRKASICANSHTEALRRWLGEGPAWGVDLDYYEDTFPRGPAGCILDAVSPHAASAWVVVDATIYPEMDLAGVLAAHEKTGAALTVVGAQSPHSSSSDATLTPAGVYVISPSALKHVPAVGYQDIKEALIPHLYTAGLPVGVYVVRERTSPRVTDAASYLAVHRTALWAMSETAAGNEYVAQGESRIHESACVHAGARLVGPVWIGPDTIVEAGAIVTGPTALGARCTVGPGAVVSRTVAWDGCAIGEGAVLDHSLLTRGAEVRRGATLRNSILLTRPRGSSFWHRTPPAQSLRVRGTLQPLSA